MRNLVSLARRSTPLRPLGERSAGFSALRVDSGGRRAFFLCADGQLGALELPEGAEAEPAACEPLVDLAEALAAGGAGEGRWRWVDYVAEMDALVCASTGGALVAVDVEARFADEVGALEGGIRALAWSGDQEKLAVATGVGTLVVMNQQWDVLHEARLGELLPAAAVQDDQSFELCWREDGRFLALNVEMPDNGEAQQKVVVLTDELQLHSVGRLEDGRAIPGLGSALHWSPNQSLIASSEARGDGWWVVFFERNGLRHGEFQLPSELTKAEGWNVDRMKWNAESDMLAVLLRQHKNAILQLWSRGNYHWYLKQERKWLAGEELIEFEWDDETTGKLYLLMSSRSDEQEAAFSLLEEEFTWDVTSIERQQLAAVKNEPPQPKSLAVTAVIDGRKLLLTPLHQALVPPPFAFRTVEFAAPVNSVAFDHRSETLVGLLSTGDICIVHDYLSTKPQIVPISCHTDSNNLSSLLWVNYNSASQSVAMGAKSGWNDMLATATTDLRSDVLHFSAKTNPVMPIRRCGYAFSSFNGADTQSALSTIVLQTSNGDVYTVEINSSEATLASSPRLIAQGLPVFSHLAVSQVEPEDVVVVGLQQQSARLYVDSKVLIPGCSSFRVSPVSSTLLCTTVGSDPELRLFSLDSLKSSHGSFQPEARKIEQGARIVAVVGDRAGVVLQMPRGNLECISPRLLVLALVIGLIRRGELVSALELCRTHRLDMNLLVDYDRAAFLTDFDSQLVSMLLTSRSASVVSDRLCLFVTNLHPVDMWRTKYKSQFHTFDPVCREQPSTDNVTDDMKINTVCAALMEVISTRFGQIIEDDDLSVDALLLPFVTCAVKHTPPQFSQALSKIQLLTNDKRNQKHQQRKRAALKHFALLTSADTLFDEALGTYDLSLVRQIATLSDRDPRSYASLLDELAATQNETERKLRIDMHLRRYEAALGHLSVLVRDAVRTGQREYLEEQERRVESLVAQATLYTQALAMFHDLPGLHRQLSLLYGQHLEGEKLFSDAGFVYLAASALSDAQRAFALARQWKMAISLAIRSNKSKDEVRQLAYRIAEDMFSHQTTVEDILEVAQMYADYCDDLDEAVALLVTHKQWQEALRLALLHNRADLVETDVEPGVIQSCEDLLDELQTQEAAYIKHWKRLDVIQTQKRLFRLHGIDGRRWGNGESKDDTESDVQSVVSSTASSALSSASMSSVGSHNSAQSIGNFSIQSLARATASHFYATQALQAGAAAPKSKSKQKGGMPSRRERRNRMKQGSAEEEAYVTQQLQELKPSEALRKEVKELLEMLVFFGYARRGQQLQAQLSSFENRVNGEMPSPPSNTDEVSDASKGELRPTKLEWQLKALQ